MPVASINKSSRVSLHFALVLEDGQVVDSNFDKPPATFSFGDGSLLAAFEEVLVGLKEGDEKEFLMPPEKAFGQHNPSNVQSIPRRQFNIDIEEGVIVSFADANGNELPGVVKNIEENEVEVDFNHPLAGRSLLYKVLITGVENI